MIITLSSTFFAGIIFLTIFLKLSASLGFVDTPNARSCHVQLTPSSAGIPIFITFFSSIYLLFPSFYNNLSLSLFGILIIFFLGIYDDIKDIRARYKIIFIALAAVLASADGLIILNIGTYFGYTISLTWMAIFITIVSAIGFTNSFNLIDGLDGLAGTIGVIILGGLWLIGYQYNDALLLGFPSLLIPILLAFLIFNWNPAKIFMGDCGSLTLGFVIYLLCIKALEYISPVMVLYLIAIPLIDTLVIIARRFKNGKSIFKPDKNHLHHIFLNFFSGNVKKAVLIIALIQLIYSLVGIILIKRLPQEISLIFFILNIITWYFILTHLSKKSLSTEVSE